MGLYDTDVSEQINSIRDRIKDSLKQRIYSINNNHINKLLNLKSYQNVKLGNKSPHLTAIREETNNIFNRFGAKSTVINLDEIKSNFQEQFKQRCWELVCLNRFSDFFTGSMEKPKNTADLNYEEVIVECTSVSTGKFPDFVKILPFFTHLLSLLRLFYKNSKLISSNLDWRNFIKEIWENFNAHNKELTNRYLLRIKLSYKSSEDILRVYELLDILDSISQYNDIIPCEIINSLKRVGIDLNSGRRLARYHIGLSNLDYKFISDRLGLSLIDKLKKPYFSNQEKPIIVSITLENYANDFCYLIDSNCTKKLFDFLMNSPLNFSQKKFQHKFSNQRSIKYVVPHLSKLYALHINTSGLGWFPDKLGCWGTAKKNSCELIFYNTDHCLSGKYQFDNLGANIGKLSFSKWVSCQDNVTSI